MGGLAHLVWGMLNISPHTMVADKGTQLSSFVAPFLSDEKFADLKKLIKSEEDNVKNSAQTWEVTVYKLVWDNGDASYFGMFLLLYFLCDNMRKNYYVILLSLGRFFGSGPKAAKTRIREGWEWLKKEGDVTMTLLLKMSCSGTTNRHVLHVMANLLETAVFSCVLNEEGSFVEGVLNTYNFGSAMGNSGVRFSKKSRQLGGRSVQLSFFFSLSLSLSLTHEISLSLSLSIYLST